MTRFAIFFLWLFVTALIYASGRLAVASRKIKILKVLETHHFKGENYASPALIAHLTGLCEGDVLNALHELVWDQAVVFKHCYGGVYDAYALPKRVTQETPLCG